MARKGTSTTESTTAAPSEATKESATRLYIVANAEIDEKVLVEATSASAAIRIVTAPKYTAHVATPKEIAALTGAAVLGAKVT